MGNAEFKWCGDGDEVVEGVEGEEKVKGEKERWR